MSTTAAYTGKDPDGGPGDRRAMKVCQVCGDIYRDHVDFCFNDGEILVADAAVTSPLSAAHLELDPPMPRRVQGAQAPATGWPQAVPVSRPGAAQIEAQANVPSSVQVDTPVAPPRSTPTPAIVRSTDITVPPESVAPPDRGGPAAEAVASANRDAGRPIEPDVVDVVDDASDESVVRPTPSVQSRAADDTTASAEPPTIPPLLPSSVPTPVTPEARDVLRVAPNNDRPSAAHPAVGAAAAQTSPPAPIRAAASGTPAPAVPSDTDLPPLRPVPGRSQTPAPGAAARPVNPPSSQIRGSSSSSAIALDPGGERSNWLMIGAVFAVGVLFSVMGAGAVLAGMLYQGAPWGGEVEEPVTQHDPPAPVTVPRAPDPAPPDVEPNTPAPVVEAPVPVLDPVPLQAPTPSPSPVTQPVPVVQAPKPAPEPIPPGEVRYLVKLAAIGPALVTNAKTGTVLADPSPRVSKLAPGKVSIRYSLKGMVPIERECEIPDPTLPEGGVTDCSIVKPFVPVAEVEPPKPMPSTAQTIKTNVIGPNGATVSIDGAPPLETNQSYPLEVGTHECVVNTWYGTFPESCDVVPSMGPGGVPTSVGILNLSKLIPPPPNTPVP